MHEVYDGNDNRPKERIVDKTLFKKRATLAELLLWFAADIVLENSKIH